MSMPHKAYEFDYKAFQRELEKILFLSLETGSTDELVQFVNANLRFCKYPWDSAKLPETWQEALETGDSHETGDYALTKFYNPDNDHGLGHHYIELSDKYRNLDRLVLGTPFGPETNRFDPGKMGSYFLKPEEIGHAVINLKKIPDGNISGYADFLASCLENDKGVYITF